ncbi:hypothetical protein [Streptomyces olivaceiscleroticus]|uniref:Uncharacterized protein n=1 Tax=Streptomyces olivaceiscleroticus TaxID=68245 RepID=A0ABP3JSH9_9ACTN
MAPGSRTVLVTVTLPPGSTLQDAQRRLGLADDEVDAAYGLVSIDPARNLFALMVTEEAGSRIKGLPGTQGPYANPRIHPFGPARPDDECGDDDTTG